MSGTGYFGLGAFTSTTGTTTVASGQGFAVGGSQLVVQQGSGNVGIGTASPGYELDVNGDVNVASGKCFRVGGACIGYVTKLAAIYATSTVGTTTVAFGNGGPRFSNGTLTLPASTTQMTVEVWGGGGGGGKTNANSAAPGGGGSGAYVEKIITSPSSTYYFTVGAGGAGDTSGSGGSAGNPSCFGTNSIACASPVVGAGGGSGGWFSVHGGLGGTVTTGGDINLVGGAGHDGYVANTPLTALAGGNGGNAPRGGSGGLAYYNQQGSDGSAPGGGGAGGGYSGGATNGGDGAPGGLVITVYATSSPTAAGNDYAEMFPVSNPLITAGDIVAVDAGMPVSMKLAAADEGAPLAGIIATNPGQVLGDINATGERPVALSGRVPAKVNLEGGPIQIGDRIAPSSVPGVGKKASALDASVGIALESFSGADG